MNTERPWMTALEMQFATLALLRNVALRSDADNAETVLGATSLAKALSQADCFSWNRETAGAVLLASRTVPADSGFTTDMLPARNGWWWFETSIKLDTETCQALAWGPDEDDPGWIKFWLINERPDVTHHNIPIPSLLIRLRDGLTAQALLSVKPTDERPTVVKILLFVLAATAWLAQRVVIYSSGHVERHHRKRLEREHNVSIASDVKVIQLRRSESQSNPPSAAEGEQIDWSCRWIVGGHWRNQPYKDERKLIYIMPYVKGPEDKPLKVPTHTVYQVSR